MRAQSRRVHRQFKAKNTAVNRLARTSASYRLRRNVMRMTFHPQGMQPRLKNWPQVATLLLNRLHRELAADPTHQALRQLLADVSRFPGVSASWRSQDWLSGSPPPIFPMEYDLGEHTLKVFSMVSTFGTALDVTADELRVETFFPADEFSRSFFHMLSA